MNSWFGTEFNRYNTWFEKGKAWADYFRRSQFLLQQGHYAADVAYFIGEDAPKMSGIRQPELPLGYACDYINGEVIRERLQVKDGRFVLPDGMSYRLLVLPPLETMRPELLLKLRDLVASGGAVMGQPPKRSPSMQNYPKADLEVQKMAQKIWGKVDGKTTTEGNFGKGRVFWGISVQDAMNRLEVSPDITGLNNVQAKLWTGLDGAVLPWIHRITPEGEIYYISNQADQMVSVAPSFRVAGRQPELWDAVTSEHRILPEFRQENGRTIVPLEFAPRQSLFVIFRQPTQKQGSGRNFPPLKEVAAKRPVDCEVRSALGRSGVQCEL